MFKTNTLVYSVLSFVCFLAAAVLFGIETAGKYPAAGFAGGLLFGVCLLLQAVCAYKEKPFGNAFVFSNRYRLELFAAAASLGFFALFVRRSADVYLAAVASKPHLAYLTLCAACAVCALLSGLFFAAVALSYGDTGYDFRKLKVLLLAPLLWAAAEVCLLVETSLDTPSTLSSVLKICALVFALCYYYAFAFAAASGEGSRPVFVFFAAAFAGAGVLFFFVRVLLFTKQTQITESDGVLATAMMPMGGFAYFLKLHIACQSTAVKAE